MASALLCEAVESSSQGCEKRPSLRLRKKGCSMTGTQKPSVAGAKPREWPQVQGCSKLHGETLPKKTTEKMKNTDLPSHRFQIQQDWCSQWFLGLFFCFCFQCSRALQLTLQPPSTYPVPQLSDPCLLPAVDHLTQQRAGLTLSYTKPVAEVADSYLGTIKCGNGRVFSLAHQRLIPGCSDLPFTPA